MEKVIVKRVETSYIYSVVYGSGFYHTVKKIQSEGRPDRWECGCYGWKHEKNRESCKHIMAAKAFGETT